MTAAPAQSTFFYRAMTPTGGTRMGFRAASDIIDLTNVLSHDDLLLIRSWRLPIGASATKREPSKIPGRDEVAINEQIAALLDRGVTLTEALEVASDVASAASKGRIDRLRELVASGASFADACSQVGGFDPVSIAVYRAAERSGDLAPAARRLSIAARRKQAMAAKAITVMIYPIIVIAISLLILSGMLIFIVPGIAQNLRSLGATEMPWYSDAIFNLGGWMRANLLAVVIGAVGLAVVAWLMRGPIANLILAIGRRLGIVAALLRAIELTRLFAVLAAMTRSGVLLSEALSLSVSVISDPKLRSQLEWLQRSLVEGGVLRRLLEDVDALPLATRRLLIAAERGGDLDQAFDQLSGDMAEEVDTRSSRLLALLEPLIIVGMFLVLVPLILAIAVPLISRSGIGG